MKKGRCLNANSQQRHAGSREGRMQSRDRDGFEVTKLGNEGFREKGV